MPVAYREKTQIWQRERGFIYLLTFYFLLLKDMRELREAREGA